jgi:hypothetical protein
MVRALDRVFMLDGSFIAFLEAAMMDRCRGRIGARC